MSNEPKPSSAADVNISPLAEKQTAATPAGAANRTAKPSRLPMLLIAVGVCGVGSLIVLASTMRSSVAPANAAPPAPAANLAAPKTTAPSVNPAPAKEPQATAGHTAVRTDGPTPLWRTKRAYLRGRDVVTFELPADEDVPVWQSLVRPVLTIRCERKTSEVFVMTYTPSSFERARQHTVKVTFDGGTELTQEWEHSVNHDALFAPPKTDLARQIARADKMSFTFTPFNAQPAVTKFSVGGFTDQVTPALQRACGWAATKSGR